MPRLHKGRPYEYFFYRDMCGEEQQFPPDIPCKYAFWQEYRGAGSLCEALSASHIVSDECLGNPWDKYLQWNWGHFLEPYGNITITYTCEFFYDDRRTYCELDVIWDTGAASASKTFDVGQMVKCWCPFSRAMLWDTHASTDLTVWDWRSGPVSTILTLGARRYPWPP